MSLISEAQRDEIMREFAASRAHQEAMLADRLFAEGKFQFHLVPTAEEVAGADQDFQAALTSFASEVRKAGVPIAQSAIAFDSADSHGFPLPDFTIAILVLGPPTIAAIAAAAGTWVQARYGRKVRLRVGDTEAEGRSAAEIVQLLEIAATYRRDNPVGDE
jgi:hypothetical protein